MFKFIKRLFGLDYNDPKPNNHYGVGYAGETTENTVFAAASHAGIGYTGIETVESEVPVANVAEEAAPVKEKKPRKPAAKKAAPKKAAKKAK